MPQSQRVWAVSFMDYESQLFFPVQILASQIQPCLKIKQKRRIQRRKKRNVIYALCLCGLFVALRAANASRKILMRGPGRWHDDGEATRVFTSKIDTLLATLTADFIPYQQVNSEYIVTPTDSNLSEVLDNLSAVLKDIQSLFSILWQSSGSQEERDMLKKFYEWYSGKIS